MGGMDWAALPVIAEMLGVKNIDALIMDLTVIRDWQNRSRDESE